MIKLVKDRMKTSMTRKGLTITEHLIRKDFNLNTIAGFVRKYYGPRIFFSDLFERLSNYGRNLNNSIQINDIIQKW